MELAASWRDIFGKSLTNGLAGLLGFAAVLVNSACAGHANAARQEQVAMLAGYGLAQAVQNVLHIGPAIGLSNVLDTLISQANGARQMQKCVFFLGQGRTILTLHWLIICPIAWFSESWLVSIGIDPLSAHFAAVFNRINIIGWFLKSQTFASQKFLSNLNRPRANLCISVVTVIQHCACVLSIGFDVGLVALAWVTVASAATQSILLFVYLVSTAPRFDMQASWFVSNLVVFRGWGSFLKLAGPGIVQACSELWALEVFTVVSSYLGTTSLAACTVTYNVTAVGYIIAMGFSSAASGLVGEAIGKGRAQAAQRTAVRFGVAGLLLWLPMGACLFFGAGFIAALFSPVPEVHVVLKPLLQLYALALLMDCLNQVAAGILRALGRPSAAAYTYLILFYLFMLPLAYVLGFPVHLEVFGMYVAYTLTSACVLLVLLAVLWRTDFQSILSESLERLQADQVCSQRDLTLPVIESQQHECK